MSQFKVPVISFCFIAYLLSLSIATQDESNRRVAYGILLANPMGMGMGAASAPYPMYQQPYYGMAGYPSSGGPMGWPIQASMYPSASSASPGFTFPGQSYQPYPAASSGSPAFSVPGQGGYFGPLTGMTGLSPYSGYSPLTMIGR